MLGNRWVHSPRHSGPYLLIHPLFFHPVSPVYTLYSQCSGIITAVSVVALFVYILLFIHKVCFLWGTRVGWKFKFFKVRLTCPPENPSQSSPSKVNLVAPTTELPQPSVTCISSECSLLPTVFLCTCLPHQNRLRQTPVQSPNPMLAQGLLQSRCPGETRERGTETRPGKGVLIEEVSNHQETLALAGPGEALKSRRAT